VVTDVRQERGVFMHHLKVKALHTFETSGTSNTATHSRRPECKTHLTWVRTYELRITTAVLCSTTRTELRQREWK